MTGIRTPLIAALLAACAIGSSGAAAQPAAGHHHHHFADDVEAFHDVLAPIWHAPHGKARSDDACRQAGRMAELAQAIHSADAGALRSRLSALTERCRAAQGGIDTALFEVHEAFHRLLEAGAGNPGK